MASRGTAALRFPDWCDAEWPGPLVSMCEQYLGAPIWYTVLIADGVALWMVVSILRRQREHDGELLKRKLARPRAARARGAWRTLGALARLASTGAAGRPGAAWGGVWEKVSKSRVQRKEYLKRRNFEIGAVLSRALGPVIVLGLWLLIGFEVHAFYTVALPWFAFSKPLRLFCSVLAGFFPVRIYMDYARTTFTDPGRPDSSDAAAASVDLVEMGAPAERTCRRCQGPKPPRAHHCKVCRRCVLKMDHHCPFVANCVGLRNYKYFCRLLIELVAGCFVLAVSLAPQVHLVVSRRVAGMTLPRQLHVFAAAAVAVLVCFLLGPFFFFHLQLLIMNQTTLEFMARRSSHRQGKGTNHVVSYNRGPLENFSEVCGTPPRWCWRPLEEILRRLVLLTFSPSAKRSV